MTTLAPSRLDEPLLAASAPRRLRVGWPATALTLILLLAGLLRFSGLDREGLWGDEYFQTMQYELPPWYVVLGARTNCQPPLDYLLGWAVTKIARNAWMMRAPAAFFGVAGAGLLFVLVRRMFGAGAALLAALLLAVAPMHFKLSQESRPYTIYVCGMLLTLWALMRALEKPNRGRVGFYALCAVVLNFVRGLDPQVLLLCCGLVVTALWVFSPQDRRAAGRVWLATLAGGIVGAGVVCFLIQGDSGWSVFGAEAATRTSGITRILAALVRNAAIWWVAPTTLFGRGMLPLLVLAMCGAGLCALRWQSWPRPMRCVLAVMALAGPVHLVVFSAAVTKTPICDRYAMFLTPIALTFAAAMLAELLRHSFSPAGNRLTRGAAVFIAAAVVLLPAGSTLALSRQYFNPDWRGSAADLQSRCGAGDVVMVFEDRPLASGQSPYWGKLHWPKAARPLGESMATLAWSEPHWQRLAQAEGRCRLMIKRPVGGEGPDDYLRSGLGAAPAGLHLVKYRGLDMLENLPGDSIAAQVIAACNTLLSLPQAHRDARAIPFLLRSRAELLAGDVAAARASLAAAEACVPPELTGWFAQATLAHRVALKSVESH